MGYFSLLRVRRLTFLILRLLVSAFWSSSWCRLRDAVKSASSVFDLLPGKTPVSPAYNTMPYSLCSQKSTIHYVSETGLTDKIRV